jgi:16S rRNA C967 or C1407 C5-methylase (RsmB/RsmF family)
MLEKLPKELIDRLKIIYSKDELKSVKEGFESSNPTTFRINTIKTNYKKVNKILEEK